jgi:hypothetical protein
MELTEGRLRQMNDEIRELIARRRGRGAAELLPEVDAVMQRYGVLEPDTEGLIQWIDKTIAEVAAAC